MFPKIGVPQNGWFILEIPIKNKWFGGKTHYFQKHPYRLHEHGLWAAKCLLQYLHLEETLRKHFTSIFCGMPTIRKKKKAWGTWWDFWQTRRYEQHDGLYGIHVLSKQHKFSMVEQIKLAHVLPTHTKTTMKHHGNRIQFCRVKYLLAKILFCNEEFVVPPLRGLKKYRPTGVMRPTLEKMDGRVLRHRQCDPDPNLI